MHCFQSYSNNNKLLHSVGGINTFSLYFTPSKLYINIYFLRKNILSRSCKKLLLNSLFLHYIDLKIISKFSW